ncbi:MAG: cbb3-type cytochrome c oxidase subunit I [Nitrospirota bacterium]
MGKEVVWFIRLSLVYFLIGSLFGLLFIFFPDMANPDMVSLHVHLNLLGWMSMMIFGVGYHVLPRFSGRPLYSRNLSKVQFWLANAGFAGMGIGWGLRSQMVQGGTQLLTVFGAVMFLSIILFVYNLILTVKGPE